MGKEEIAMKTLPIVAIVGRPNVGKSTLFNRLVGKRLALEFAEAGTTRDRLYAEIAWQGKNFLLVDTAGMAFSKAGEILAREVEVQIDAAIAEADSLLFLVDGKEGVTSEDIKAAKKIRKSGKKFLFAVNKIDSQKADSASPSQCKKNYKKVNNQKGRNDRPSFYI